MMYVAYGSNMNLNQMNYRCPNSNVICNGKIKGWKLVFNIHADVIETNNANDEVPVVLWDIDDNDWYMLDRYEGYPNYYIKRIVDVVTDSGEIVKAVVYVMADNRKGICPPDEYYFNTILTGYNDNNIGVDPLYDALDYSLYNMTEHNQYNVKKG